MSDESTPPTPDPPAAPEDWSTLFENLAVGAYRSRPDGRFVRCNAALVRLSGCRTEAELIDAVGDVATDWYVEPGRRREILAMLETEGAARNLVSEIRQPTTRQRRWVRENCHVVRDADGAVVHYEGTFEDITDSVHARRALERSEALLRDVTGSVPGMVYRVHVRPDGGQHYEFVSDGVRALYGVAPDDVIADPYLLRRLRHPQDHDRVQAVMDAHLASGEPCTVEFRTRTNGGRDRWVRLSSSATRADDGSTRLHGVAIDISEAKAAEQALLESDRRWKLALESLGDGVWDWDLQTGSGYFTGPLRVAYGLPPEHVFGPGDDLDQRVHPDDRASLRRTRELHLQGRTPAYVHEHRLRRADGRWMWVLSRGVVVERDADGRALRIIGTHTDITERREAEALRQQRDRAEQADRTKSELMSRISHELRTPLNAILGFAQLLDLDAEPGTPQKEWAGHVLDSGRLLLALVDDVLDLTRGQSMQFALDPEPVALHEAFEASWAMLRAQAEAREVVLKQGTVADPALTVHADPRRLRQVLGNLLSNAIKYNRQGGHVRFDARRDDRDVVFSVADSGLGIPTEYHARVFQPFDRLGAARGHVPGTGLGLAVCKQLVEAMGGRISLSSEDDAGACFTVRLPAAPVGVSAPTTAPRPR